ncbi:MAG TPA: hypothetical protein VGH26_09200 [Gaiellaceae bacterium]
MGAEEVRGAAVAAVVLSRVAAVEFAQAVLDPGVGGVDEQVVMVRHQPVRDDAETEQGEGCLEMVEKGAPVFVVLE